MMSRPKNVSAIGSGFYSGVESSQVIGALHFGLVRTPITDVLVPVLVPMVYKWHSHAPSEIWYPCGTDYVYSEQEKTGR